MTATFPIERLPYDCLSDIFTHACISHPNRANNYLHWPKELVALQLAHLCSHWRKVLLSDTAIWSTFEYIHEPPYTQASIDCLLLYLTRSGNHILSFTIQDHKDQDPDFIVPDSRQSEFMQILCSEAYRWKRVSFTTKAPFFPASPIVVVPFLPHLECLTLMHKEKVRRPRRDFFMNAPALHSVEVQQYRKKKKTTFPTPWDRSLTSHEMYGSFILRAIHILSSCHNLRNLDFWNPFVDFTGPIPAPTVLNGVQSLVIAVMASSAVIPLFRFPDVISLTFKGMGRTVSPGMELILLLSLPRMPQF
ncbi:hypothetical protein DFS33DRAFT_127539 [Desarmillaria ectypa]|nr:hypothetical protein DFS33DRAFT_127539 [Desarmillaria ectypa]